jgi:hypothetical protein
MSADPAMFDRAAIHERENPSELLRRYFAAAGGQALGYVLVVLGVLVLVVGWFGVSREGIVAKQLPYLVSGGIGGSFMLGIGALLLITHELRLDNRRLEAVEATLEELRDALLLPDDVTVATLATNGHDPVAFEPALVPSANGNGTGTTSAAPYVIVSGGSRFHDPGCSATTGKSVTGIDLAEAHARGLQPCRLCEPIAAEA